MLAVGLFFVAALDHVQEVLFCSTGAKRVLIFVFVFFKAQMDGGFFQMLFLSIEMIMWFFSFILLIIESCISWFSDSNPTLHT